ncbi:MAG: CvpA family protein, partial [Burkholderiales bacterium]
MLDTVTGWDWFVAIVLLLSVGIGALRGLVRTVFALGAWVVALLGVPIAGPPLDRVLPDAVPHAVSYFVVFLLL